MAAHSIETPEMSPESASASSTSTQGAGQAGQGAGQGTWSRVNWPISIPFFLVHVVAVVGCWWVGFSWRGLAIAAISYAVRMFAVTGGYHRYFSHRTYRTGRVFQFVLALLCVTTVQKGVLWWASHHRHHHKHSDTDLDVHSMSKRGFWWSHMLWILSDDYSETDHDKIKDFAKYPELRFFDRFHLVIVVLFALALYLTLGSVGLMYGFFLSTVLLWHGTFTINSLAHWLGRPRFATTDDSKNSAILAIVTLGEGWHNNHHFYQRAVNQGFYWWEIDITFYVLKILSWTGLVWDLHTPPKELLARARRADESLSSFQARVAEAKKRVRELAPVAAVVSGAAATSTPITQPTA